MNAYEVTYRVWASSEEDAVHIVDIGEAEDPHVQESDDQEPPAWYLEDKARRT